MEQQSISSDLIRGHIDTIILHTLIESDKFAQQISDSIEQKSNGEYKINQATLYSSLKRLENLKFVTSYWFDSAETGGRRKFFKISDLGKETVENNLENWSYSRALIDKLVDCSPTPIYKTEIIERIVEVPVEVVKPSTESPIIQVVEEQKPIEKPPVQTETEITKAQPVEQQVSAKETQEINFRNILNGLIKVSEKKADNKPIEKIETPVLTEETIKNDVVIDENEQNDGKLRFNETIISSEFNAPKSHSNGKIDFGDMVLQASKEGYKLRISSKDSALSIGKLLINKVNFVSSLLIFLLVIAELFLIKTLGSKLITLDSSATVLAILCFALFPIITLGFYIKNPNKKALKAISADSILVSALVVFNLIVVNFAVALLFDMDFNKVNVLKYLIIPILLYLDCFIFFVIRYFISKNKNFKISQKKN